MSPNTKSTSLCQSSVVKFFKKCIRVKSHGNLGIYLRLNLPALNTVSHKKGTTSRVANSEFPIFCYWVMGPYEQTPMTPKILVLATLGSPNSSFLAKIAKMGQNEVPQNVPFCEFLGTNYRLNCPEQRYWAWHLTVFGVF